MLKVLSLTILLVGTFLANSSMALGGRGPVDLQPLIEALPIRLNWWLYFLFSGVLILTIFLWKSKIWERVRQKPTKVSQGFSPVLAGPDYLEAYRDLRIRLMREGQNEKQRLILFDKLYHLFRWYLCRRREKTFPRGWEESLSAEEKKVVKQLQSFYGTNKVSFGAAIEIFSHIQEILEKGR